MNRVRVSVVTHPAYSTMLMWYMGVRSDDARFAQLIAFNDLINRASVDGASCRGIADAARSVTTGPVPVVSRSEHRFLACDLRSW